MMRCGTRRCLPRIATGCWRPKWPRNSWRGWWAGARKGMDFGRALQRGRYAAGSVGQREEFSAQGPEEFGTAGRSGKSHGELSRRAAVEPNARIENRSGGALGAQRGRQGGEVELQRKSTGGESQ